MKPMGARRLKVFVGLKLTRKSETENPVNENPNIS